MIAPLVVINAVGLTSRLLPFAPKLRELGRVTRLLEVLPAVTCTAQASILTGRTASGHGIVGNGWLYRDTREVRFWQQANSLLHAEPVYATLRRQARATGRVFRCAKLFWWFNQGAEVDISVTPKPYYGADGNKIFGITGSPDGLCESLEKKLGPFPFATFWGPMAGLPCTQWIARAAAEVLHEPPDLTLVYLPHLDYEPQKYGPARCNMAKLVGELDSACEPLLDAAKKAGARVWVLSEYGHVDVRQVVEPNRALRRAGFLKVRGGPFGEQLDTFGSRAFAVCDHQLAHIYVRDSADIEPVASLLAGLPGIGRIVLGEARRELGLDHPRSGEIIALSAADAWFAYPFWLDDRLAPDYARTVAIHHKPGYDPCELFLDPRLWFAKGRVAWRLLQKKVGFRTLFDVIPLDSSLVGGSHGVPADDPLDRPIWLSDLTGLEEEVPMTAVYEHLKSNLSG